MICSPHYPSQDWVWSKIRSLRAHRNLFWQLSRDWNFHGSGSVHKSQTAPPKSSFRAPWRVGNAVVGRGNAGWTTSKSGRSCSCQSCSQRPHVEKTGRGSQLNRPYVPPTTQSVESLNWTEFILVKQFQTLWSCWFSKPSAMWLFSCCFFFGGGVSSFHSNVVLPARGDFMKTGSSMEQTATTKIMRANNQLSQEHEDTDEKWQRYDQQSCTTSNRMCVYTWTAYTVSYRYSQTCRPTNDQLIINSSWKVKF